MKQKQQLNEIQRMQQLAGIKLNELEINNPTGGFNKVWFEKNFNNICQVLIDAGINYIDFEDSDARDADYYKINDSSGIYEHYEEFITYEPEEFNKKTEDFLIATYWGEFSLFQMYAKEDEAGDGSLNFKPLGNIECKGRQVYYDIP